MFLDVTLNCVNDRKKNVHAQYQPSDKIEVTHLTILYRIHRMYKYRETGNYPNGFDYFVCWAINF